MHYLYILYSDSTQKFYIGETNNLENRILKHQDHFYSNHLLKLPMIGKLFSLLTALTEKKRFIWKNLLKG